MTADASRPIAVHRAALCLWLSAVLALLVTIAQALRLVDIPSGTTVRIAALTGIITVGLLGGLAATIGLGQNWARWAYAVIYVIGTLGAVAVAPAVFFAQPLILKANMILQLALQTAAFVLVFTKSSRQWFNARRASAAP